MKWHNGLTQEEQDEWYPYFLVIVDSKASKVLAAHKNIGRSSW